MSDTTSLSRAIDTVNGTGAGGPEFAGKVCLVAFGDGVAPAEILAGVRQRASKDGSKLSQLRTHEGIVWGSFALHTLGEKHFATEDDKSSPMANVIKWSTAIGATAVRTVLEGAGSEADKAQEIRTRWQYKMDEAALKQREARAAKETPEFILAGVKSQVETLSLLALEGELSVEATQLVASILDELRPLVGIKVGADA